MSGYGNNDLVKMVAEPVFNMLVDAVQDRGRKRQRSKSAPRRLRNKSKSTRSRSRSSSVMSALSSISGIPSMTGSLQGTSAPVTVTNRRRKKKRKGKRKGNLRFNRRIRKIVNQTPIRSVSQIKVTKISGVIGCGANQCSYNDSIADDINEAALRVANKTSLTGLCDNEFQIVNAAGTAETYNLTSLENNGRLNYHITGMLDMVNNYNFPAHCTVYHCVVKRGGTTAAVAPVEMIIEGLGDRDVSNPSSNICYYANHSKLFQEKYKVVKQESIVIQPGEHAKYWLNTGKRYIDIRSLQDNAVENIANRTQYLVVRMQGAIGHEESGGATTDDVGYLEAQLDCVFTTKARFSYSGFNQKQRYTTNTTNLVSGAPTALVNQFASGNENKIDQ